MKKFFLLVGTALFFLCASWSMAASNIPNLVGTWSISSEGGVLLKAEKTGEKTHWVEGQKTLSAEAKILKQDGRLIQGEFITKKATEKFIAVIAPDNKSIALVDEDGTMDLKIINKNMLQGIYRHIGPTDSVLAIGTWKRKK